MSISYRKTIFFTLLAGAFMGAAGVLTLLFHRPRWFMPMVQKATHRDVLFHVDTQQQVIALTIDDGPHATITPKILDVLADHNVRASFFLIGMNVLGNERIVERIVAEGHEIGNHMLVDERSIDLSSREFLRQLQQTDRILRQFARPTWFRPGSGFYTHQMVEQIKTNGYRLVVGSVYPYDAQVPATLDATEFLTNHVVANTVPGSIIVLHDGQDDRERVVGVLERLLPTLLDQGYRFLTVSELADLQDDSPPTPYKAKRRAPALTY